MEHHGTSLDLLLKELKSQQHVHSSFTLKSLGLGVVLD